MEAAQGPGAPGRSPTARGCAAAKFEARGRADYTSRARARVDGDPGLAPVRNVYRGGATCPRPSWSEPSGATRGRASSPTSSPRTCAWSSAIRAATTPGTRIVVDGETLRPPAHPERRALLPHRAGDRQRRRRRPGGARRRVRRRSRPGAIDTSRLVVSGNAHLIMPYHYELDRATERRSARTSSAPPSGGSARPTPTRRPASGFGSRTCSTRRSSARSSTSCCGRRTPSWPRSTTGSPLDADEIAEQLPRRARPADRADDRRHGRARARGARRRRARHARGGPGDLPRPRPRHLSLRHLLEPDRRRRLRRDGHRADATSTGWSASPRPTSPASAPDPFPTEVDGEIGRPARRAGPRVRHEHRPPPPAGLARPRDAAATPCGSTRSRRSPSPSSTCSRTSPTVKVCVGYEADGERLDRRPVPPVGAAPGRRRSTRSSPGWQEDLSGATSVEDLPARGPRLRRLRSPSTPGCRSPTSASAPAESSTSASPHDGAASASSASGAREHALAHGPRTERRRRRHPGQPRHRRTLAPRATSSARPAHRRARSTPTSS